MKKFIFRPIAASLFLIIILSSCTGVSENNFDETGYDLNPVYDHEPELELVPSDEILNEDDTTNKKDSCIGEEELDYQSYDEVSDGSRRWIQPHNVPEHQVLSMDYAVHVDVKFILDRTSCDRKGVFYP